MRKIRLAIFATLLALLFAPVLWGLPPPGDLVLAELAWEQESIESQWQLYGKNDHRAEVDKTTMSTLPAHGGVRLLTRLTTPRPDDATCNLYREGRPRGLIWSLAGGARSSAK